MLLDVGAGLLDQPVVADARGARGQAGHAAEAAVEVLHGGRRELDRPVDEPRHEQDPPARRVHLLLPQRPVGGTRRQAEPAVDAVVDELARDVDGHTSTCVGSNSARMRSARAISARSRGSVTGSGTYATPAATRTTAASSPPRASPSAPGANSRRPRDDDCRAVDLFPHRPVLRPADERANGRELFLHPTRAALEERGEHARPEQVDGRRRHRCPQDRPAPWPPRRPRRQPARPASSQPPAAGAAAVQPARSAPDAPPSRRTACRGRSRRRS